MKKIWLIIQREYLTRVRKKAFLVTTFLVPVLFVAAIIGIAFISSASEEQLRLAVKDDSGLFENKVRGLDQTNLKFTYYGPDAAGRDVLLDTYAAEDFDGLLYIPELDVAKLAELDYLPQLSYYASQTVGYKTKSFLEAELSEVMRKEMIREAQLDPAMLEKLDRQFRIQAIVGDEAESGSLTGIATAIGYLVAFIIYIYLFAYGAMVMRSVMEEKSNRIVEVIITTVRPFQLMMGKIIGIGAVGLTQLVIWGVVFNGLYFLAALTFAPGLESSSPPTMMGGGEMAFDQQEMALYVEEILADLSRINWFRVITAFLFFFGFGYVLYASQFAAVGAAASDDGDVQTLMFPISIPIIISIVIMMTIIEQPNSGLAVWASLIPFTSPVVMMARIPFGIPVWQQLLSMAILFGTSLAMVWVAGRVYRIGILIQGQKPGLKQLWRWVVG